MQYLKIRIGTYHSSLDFIAYRTEVLLDTEKGTADNEFEVCWFNLRAQLRYQHKSFAGTVLLPQEPDGNEGRLNNLNKRGTEA